MKNKNTALSAIFESVTEGGVKLSDEFKKTLTEAFEIVQAENKAEIKKLTETNAKLAKVNEKLKKDIPAKVEEAVEEYKKTLVGQITSFFEHEIPDVLGEDVMALKAENAKMKPIVEGVMSVMSQHGVEVEPETEKLLKESREAVEKMSAKVDKYSKRYNDLKEATEKLATKTLLEDKMAGLTEEQKGKVSTILENATKEEIERKFDKVKKFVISETTKTVEPKMHEKKKAPVASKSNRIDEGSGKMEFGADLL